MPDIEPESGLPYSVLFERMKAAYLAVLKQFRDYVDTHPEAKC